jgi:hypothetical protein
MRKAFLAALALLLLGTTSQGQPPPVMVGPPPPPAPPGLVGPPPPVVDPRDVFWSAPPAYPDAVPERLWFYADYLLWWIRNGPVNTPLVTTGSATDAVPGALGQPGTSVLFGNRPLQFGAFNGLRLGAGFDLGLGWSLEGGFFGLERRAATFLLASDDNGNPLIARPVFNNQAGARAAYLDALPGVLTGNASVIARSQLQSYELNVAAQLYRDPSLGIDLLAGFRTLQLNEDLGITDNVTALVPGVLTFLGGPADPPNSLTIIDRFHVYNRFYGGQVGGRVFWQPGRFDLGLTAKLALGATQRLALIDGATNLNSPGSSPTTNVGGILAQPSNIGRFFQSSFGVIPEVGLDVGYWILPQVRLGVGYDFLYWNRVARPGNLIDSNVNPAQVPRDPNFGNGLGDARPAFQFHQSAFWAQGFRVGLRVQY